MLGFGKDKKLLKVKAELKSMKKTTRMELSNIHQRLIEITNLVQKKGAVPLVMLRYVEKDVKKLHASLK